MKNENQAGVRGALSMACRGKQNRMRREGAKEDAMKKNLN
jgi:hypothetical protein